MTMENSSILSPRVIETFALTALPPLVRKGSAFRDSFPKIFEALPHREAAGDQR